MTQFILSALSNDVSYLKGVITDNIAPKDSIELASNVWLVAFEGTAQKLAEQLGLEDGAHGNYIIASMNGVNGFVPQPVIQWIDEHDRNT